MSIHKLNTAQSNLLRNGEDGDIPSRSPRVFKNGSDWFFKTREGAVIGPYTSENSASKGLDNFIEFLSLAPPTTLAHFQASLSVNEA